MIKTDNKQVSIIDGKVVVTNTLKQKVDIINGKLTVASAKIQWAEERQAQLLIDISNRIKNKKKVSKHQALKLGKIELNKILSGNKTSFMCKAYSEEDSQVGLLTAAMAIICSLTENAWVVNGKIDLDLFYRAFVCCDRKVPGVKDHWDSIFTTKSKSLVQGLELEYNPLAKFDIFYISNVEIAAFKYQLQSLDPSKITYTDIKKIVDDLYHLFRAFQESSIDVTKDKDKDFKIKWSDIIGMISRKYSKYPENYTDNLEEIIKDSTVQYKISVKSKETSKQTGGDILCDEILETHCKFINEQVLSTVDGSITATLQNTMGMSEGLSVEEKLHAEHIISIASASFKSEDKLSSEDYKAIRDALYTIVSVDNDDAVSATGVIIDLICAKYRMSFNGKLERNKNIEDIRLGTAKMILGGILPLYILNREGYVKSFRHDEFMLFKNIEEGQALYIQDGSILADGEMVGCLAYDSDNEEEICSIVSETAYLYEGDLYAELNIYEDVNCNVETLVIEQLYHEASIQDIKDNKANDNFGRSTLEDMSCADSMTITGMEHNLLVLEDAEGNCHVRGKLNAYSAKMTEECDTLSINGHNTIAVHIPYNKDTDTMEYHSKVLIFC